MSVNQATKYAKRWLRRAGFQNYRLTMREMTPKEARKHWAYCIWDIEEEHVLIAAVPDGTVPDEVMDLVMLHEVAHGLCRMAQAAPFTTLEELACNRIVRLVRPRKPLPNEWSARTASDAVPPELSGLSRQQWVLVSAAVDTLPFSDREREIFACLFYDGLSLRAAAERVGVGKDTVARTRDRMLYLIARALQSRGLA